MLPTPPRTYAERTDWLRLIRSENVGPSTFFALIRRCGSAARALEEVPRLARRGGAATLRLCTLEEATREQEALAAFGGRLVALGEPDYPRLLAAIEMPPPLLSVVGHIHLFEKRSVALVGARNASAAGIRMARVLAQELGAAGLVIVSGLARGIDAAAHRGALETGTVAVLAGGLDVVYPQENRELYDAIARQGVLVSEMPLGMAPQARHFPRRNRLVSGLSLATVVVEAAERSGSLITARLAGEQGRDVMAVPGSPLDPRTRGANRLIREGAALIQDATDVLHELEGRKTIALTEPSSARDWLDGQCATEDDEARLQPLRALLLERLGPTPIEIDELVRQIGAEPGELRTLLIELELAGRLTWHPGQRVSLLPSP